MPSIRVSGRVATARRATTYRSPVCAARSRAAILRALFFVTMDPFRPVPTPRPIDRHNGRMRESKTLVLVASVRVGDRWLGIWQALLPCKSLRRAAGSVPLARRNWIESVLVPSDENSAFIQVAGVSYDRLALFPIRCVHLRKGVPNGCWPNTEGRLGGS